MLSLLETTIPWALLALACALLLATADAVTKRFLSDYAPIELTIVRFSATAVFLVPWFPYDSLAALPLEAWASIAALLPLEILATLLYMDAVRTTPLSLTLPYLAFTPALSIVTAWFFLEESASLTGLCGVLLVALGGFWLNASAPKEPPSPQSRWLWPAVALARTPGSRKMLAVALIYAITSTIGKRVLSFIPPFDFAALYLVLLTAASMVTFLPMQRARVNVLWRRPIIHLLVGCLMASMMLLHFTTIQRIEVAYFIAVKRTSLLFGILYGAVFFRETKAGMRLGAGLVMVVGVALIALGK